MYQDRSMGTPTDAPRFENNSIAGIAAATSLYEDDGGSSVRNLDKYNMMMATKQTPF